MGVMDILNSLGSGDDGSVLYPETFITDLTSAYDADMELPASRIAVLEADLAAAQTEILLLKAHNYELLTSQPVMGEPEDSPEGEDFDDEEPQEKTVDSLFGKADD